MKCLCYQLLKALSCFLQTENYYITDKYGWCNSLDILHNSNFKLDLIDNIKKRKLMNISIIKITLTDSRNARYDGEH